MINCSWSWSTLKTTLCLFKEYSWIIVGCNVNKWNKWVFVSCSIKSQKEEQKEDQGNSCSSYVLGPSVSGQRLPLLCSPWGHGGRSCSAWGGDAAEQRCVLFWISTYSAVVEEEEEPTMQSESFDTLHEISHLLHLYLYLFIYLFLPVFPIRRPSVSAPGRAWWRRPASISARLCAQCNRWGCRARPCCTGSGKRVVWVSTRRPFDRHSRRRPGTHLCTGERRLVMSRRGQSNMRLHNLIIITPPNSDSDSENVTVGFFLHRRPIVWCHHVWCRQ